MKRLTTIVLALVTLFVAAAPAMAACSSGEVCYATSDTPPAWSSSSWFDYAGSNNDWPGALDNSDNSYWNRRSYNYITFENEYYEGAALYCAPSNMAGGATIGTSVDNRGDSHALAVSCW